MITPGQAFWIGHPGSLLPLWGAKGSVSVDRDEGVVVRRGMGGGVRVRVPRTRAPRSWDIDIPGSTYDSHLETLLTATLPPYVLVTPDAQVGNVLTPERSMLSGLGLALGGYWPVAGQTSERALVRLNPSAAFGNIASVYSGLAPTPPTWTGRKVTVSAMLGTARAAGARVALLWRNAAGAPTGNQVNGNFVTGMDGLRRSVATGTPPAGAVSCEITFQYAEVISRPQVTWTDAPVPEWSVGKGADRVVIEGYSSDLVLADDRPGKRARDVSFTATEIGPA